MNYRERMRKAIECPQFGNSTYGEYGALRLDQRKNIKRLLDEMDRADEVIKHQYFELERYKNRIDKAIGLILEKITYDDEYPGYMQMLEVDYNDLLEILQRKSDE